ncbi:sigma-70 family RNA polymerase sigma factor [Asanoa iriomotensis]|uniref:DNA-directed RNA polymerase sigma-70 factor n=1 Tax=Asanoa iriomotensis TaxID=234613 RepID=A0ABQ4C112_9ACTN|nr:sigma-70 family RNA polymerase sigma factor [Asanoa iriomotensis]GIF56459.1 DNA-directed RNA polymerase sigma-70 factor [Asanoa iriomotensis]
MTDQFEAHRPYLHAIAYRMLGSHADADDAVQEAWLRLARTGTADIAELRGWLTTVTSRICLDMLRRRKVRGEEPLELDIDPRPAAEGGDPEAEALLAESVGLALYVVMDQLTPAERVSFVLHDVFEVPFDTIADILDRSTAATKMLASRARGRLRLGTPPEQEADRGVVDAFLAAAGNGDVAALLTVLAPDVELTSRSPQGTVVIRGAERVANQAATFARPDAVVRPALVAGVPGILVIVGGRPVTAMGFTVTDGLVTAIHGVTDPVRLGQLVPSWVSPGAPGGAASAR